MAIIKDAPRCPKCSKVFSMRHCVKSTTCSWFRCNHCLKGKNWHVVFDAKGRFFETGME